MALMRDSRIMEARRLKAGLQACVFKQTQRGTIELEPVQRPSSFLASASTVVSDRRKSV
jgi:hypothetical protein